METLLYQHTGTVYNVPIAAVLWLNSHRVSGNCAAPEKQVQCKTSKPVAVKIHCRSLVVISQQWLIVLRINCYLSAVVVCCFYF